MKFLIATGGTGGHVFPALKVAEELNHQGHEVVLAGSFNRVQDIIVQSGFTFEEIGARGLVLALRVETLRSVTVMIRAVFKSLRLMHKVRPDAVIGFGGYGAFPLVLAALLRRCPTMIHEQNVRPGRANALLANRVDKVAVSFERSRAYFNNDKTVLTGCPGRNSGPAVTREAALKVFGLTGKNKTLLIFGGSQGSRRINEACVESISRIRQQHGVQVVHLCGKGGQADLKQRYQQSGISFALFDFLDKMEDAYAAADLVIARAGAATVSELIHYRLPAVLIPYPHAGGHQKDNAAVLCDLRAARLIEEKDLTPSKLAEEVCMLLDQSARGHVDPEIFKKIDIPEADKKLVFEAIQLTA